MRDALLGRQADYLDLDFVLPERVVDTAKAIANHYRAGFVLLDVKHQIARVVFDRATVDFALQVGPTLETDLERRDFTVNAIAYNPHTQSLIDPLGGFQDLQAKRIRMIAPENLKEDPLRLLRAYRQAAQLGFTVEQETQVTIRQFAGLLSEIAPERVQSELNYLLSTSEGTPFLTMAWEDGLLTHWLPGTTGEGMAQITRLDAAAIALNQRWPELGDVLSGWMKSHPRHTGLGRTWLKIAKMASLVDSDLTVAEQQLWRLKYSRAEVQAVLTVLRELPELMEIVYSQGSRRQQYELFRSVGATFPALVALVVAKGMTLEAIAPLIHRFLSPSDPVAHPVPLLTGNHLMQALNLTASPKIGQLLSEIQMAQAEGKVSNAEEALEFARQLQRWGEVGDDI